MGDIRFHECKSSSAHDAQHGLAGSARSGTAGWPSSNRDADVVQRAIAAFPRLILRSDLPRETLDGMAPRQRFYVKTHTGGISTFNEYRDDAQRWLEANPSKPTAPDRGLVICACLGGCALLAMAGAPLVSIAIGLAGAAAVFWFIDVLPSRRMAREWQQRMEDIQQFTQAEKILLDAGKAAAHPASAPPSGLGSPKAETASQKVLLRASQQQEQDSLHPIGKTEACSPSIFFGESKQVDLGNVSVDAARAQGRRDYQEDRWLAQRFAWGSIVAVFDGHGGSEAAELAMQEVPRALDLRLRQPDRPHDAEGIRQLLKDAFYAREGHGSRNREWVDIGRIIRAKPKDKSGCTALVAIFLPSGTYIVNLGDSRAIEVTRTGIARRLTADQKPGDAHELAKLRKRRIRVFDDEGVQRINGGLAVSRSLGDVDYPIMRRPVVTVIQPDHGPLVLASDGVFDALSDQDAGAFVAECGPSKQAATGLVAAAFNRGSPDNLTALVVRRQ